MTFVSLTWRARGRLFIASRSKAQWKKAKPKSCCQCHACGEREGEGQNSSYVHRNHPSSAMFEVSRGWRRPHAKQTIAIAVKYPMKSAAIIISASITPGSFGTMLQ
jgi:hypothetical protein